MNANLQYNLVEKDGDVYVIGEDLLSMFLNGVNWEEGDIKFLQP
jgi:hypothetical protein